MCGDTYTTNRGPTCLNTALPESAGYKRPPTFSGSDEMAVWMCAHRCVTRWNCMQTHVMVHPKQEWSDYSSGL